MLLISVFVLFVIIVAPLAYAVYDLCYKTICSSTVRDGWFHNKNQIARHPGKEVKKNDSYNCCNPSVAAPAK